MAHESGTRKDVDVADQIMLGIDKGDVESNHPADFIDRGKTKLVVIVLQVGQGPLAWQFVTCRCCG